MTPEQRAGQLLMIGTEVDDPGVRFDEALYYKPTTTVKFVNTAVRYYDLNKLNDPKLRTSITTYIVEATAQTKLETAEEGAVTIGKHADQTLKIQNLIVKSSTELRCKGTEDTDIMKVEVGDVRVEGNNTKLRITNVLDNTKTVFDAASVTVAPDATVEIGQNVKNKIGTLTVDAKTPASTNAGAISFEFNSHTWITTELAMNGTADIKQATGTGGKNVPGKVWLVGNAPNNSRGTWVHGGVNSASAFQEDSE